MLWDDNDDCKEIDGSEDGSQSTESLGEKIANKSTDVLQSDSADPITDGMDPNEDKVVDVLKTNRRQLLSRVANGIVATSLVPNNVIQRKLSVSADKIYDSALDKYTINTENTDLVVQNKSSNLNLEINIPKSSDIESVRNINDKHNIGPKEYIFIIININLKNTSDSKVVSNPSVAYIMKYCNNTKIQEKFNKLTKKMSINPQESKKVSIPIKVNENEFAERGGLSKIVVQVS